MLKGLVKKFKSAVDDTEEIDEKFFAEVMKEVKDGYKEEGLEGKSIAMSGGDTDKANSIYMQLRAEYLQNKEVLDRVIAIRKKKLISDISTQHNSRYFHKLFKNEIKQKGFSTPWFNSFDFTKDGITYYTKIDFDHMDFLIIDKKGNTIHRFHFEPQ